MEELLNSLVNLHATLPTTWNALNIQILKTQFHDYKSLISFLPDTYKELRSNCEHYFDLISAKIEALAEKAGGKTASNDFQEAVDYIKTQIDNVIHSIQPAI